MSSDFSMLKHMNDLAAHATEVCWVNLPDKQRMQQEIFLACCRAASAAYKDIAAETEAHASVNRGNK